MVGAGAWGLNHIRALASEPLARLTWIADVNADAAARGRELAGQQAAAVSSIERVLADSALEAVVIATPAPSHAALALAALDAGKHVLVEKPLSLSLPDAERVVALAARRGRTLAVGHLMVYHPVVAYLRDKIVAGDFGPIHYLHSTRVNLGRVRRDENALWSFGPHDLSMIDFILGQRPTEVSATGRAILQPGIEDVVFANVNYAGGTSANLHLSWLSPKKERRLVLVGGRQMAEFDDVAVDKLRIYDRGSDGPVRFTEFGEYLNLRDADVHIPRVPMVEPLRLMLRDFVTCIRSKASPRADGASALRVVEALAAASRSLAAGGMPHCVGNGPAPAPPAV